MVRTVWKYKLPLVDLPTLEMPLGARIIHVGLQHGEPCLWAEVDPEAELSKMPLVVAGTGHPLPERVGRHLGSIILYDGDLVFHVYERIGEKTLDERMSSAERRLSNLEGHRS